MDKAKNKSGREAAKKGEEEMTRMIFTMVGERALDGDWTLVLAAKDFLSGEHCGSWKFHGDLTDISLRVDDEIAKFRKGGK